MTLLKVEGLARRYGTVAVFEAVDFEIRRGEFVCLL
jgi:ABC-type Fe3+/spermidine/putrescine transport system ATPase subunit